MCAMVIYEWVMSHVWISHVCHSSFICEPWLNMNESCHTYELVMCAIAYSYVCHGYIWMSHVTCMNEAWHTYEWVMAHVRREVAHMNDCQKSPMYMSKEPYLYDLRREVARALSAGVVLSYIRCVMTYVRHDSFICVPSLMCCHT